MNSAKLSESLDSVKFADDVFLTPYKYNGGQLYVSSQNRGKRLAIAVDWFECTVHGSFLKFTQSPGVPDEVLSFSGGDVVLLADDSRPNGTKHFKHCYKVYLHGEEFGLINTSPRSSVLSSTLSIFKVQNYILYERGWVARTEFILKELGVVLNNLTRLDIAVDGGKFMDDYKMIDSGKCQLIGKGTRSSHYQAEKLDGFYIGSRSSEKYLRGYNKCKELATSNKQYIMDFWTANGLEFGDGLPPVERLEITLKRKAINRVKDFDMGKLEDASYLAGLMCSQLQKLYVFVEISDDSNKSRRKKMQPVDWSYFDAVEVSRLDKVDKPSVIWAVKQAVAFEMRESFAGLGDVSVDLWSQAYSRCYDRCKKYGILDWFEKKIAKWKKEKEYHKKMRLQVEKARNARFGKLVNSAVFTQF